MRFIIVLLLFISAAVILMMLKTNNDLIFQLEQQQQEIDASAKYIELLTEQLVENGNSSHNEMDSEVKMTDLLNEYLARKTETENDSSLTAHRQNTFIPDLVPVLGDYYVSQRFKDEHKAIDLAASLGTRVLAAATGEVVSIREDKYFGNMLILEHFNGYVTIYAHLAKILVEQGNIIKKGNIIGLVGNTGNSTGPHLHFEVISNGTQIDPETITDF